MWNVNKDITTETSIQNTNNLMTVVGAGVPVSGKEYNIQAWLRIQAEQELYRTLTPSGFITSIHDTNTIETTTTPDLDGELSALTTSSVYIANTLRLGRSKVVVNGWKVNVSNTDGTGGLHSNIVLDTAPSSSSRVDLVFLEVWLAELGGTSASISNTSNKPDSTHIYLYGNTQYKGTNAVDDISYVDAEVNRRWQIQYRIRTVDNVSIDTYPDGVDDTVNVKAWGANPLGTWSGYTAGNGSAYTFSNAVNTLGDPALYVAGDGSVTAKSVLGTVDGYVYAIPICAVFRRNSGVFDVNTNPNGCAAIASVNGNIASGVSGRPDGLYYDQILSSDIMSLRHQSLAGVNYDFNSLASDAFEKILRGNMKSYFGRGDGSGSPSNLRSMYPMYAQEISTNGALDAGFKGFSQFNYQRRIFSDASVVQQTVITFTGGSAPDNNKPTYLSPPAQPTFSTSTSSGTLAAGTYYAKITYVNAYGETLASTESSAITLGATGTVTINSPVSSGNATGWNVYLSTTSGTETKQNGTVIAIGTSYSQSSALSAGAALPVSNTTSSTVVISADSSGLKRGTALVQCVDGTNSPGSGNLPGNTNILVYSAGDLAAVSGTWSGLGTATATFTPSSTWSSDATTSGVIVVVGLYYPSGNGLTFRPENVTNQTVVSGTNNYSTGIIGISGVSGQDDSHLNSPTGVYVDNSGSIFVADTLNHRLVKYNSSFVKQAQFGTTGISGADNVHLSSPYSVVVDNSGNIYVSDSGNHRIVKLNSSLSYVAQFGVTGTSGSDNSHLYNPSQIALDGSNNIYIADTINNRIVRLTSSMTFSANFVSSLTYNPYGVAVDSSSNVFITQGNSVQEYNSGGSLVTTFGTAATAGKDAYTLNSPKSIFINGNYVYISDTSNHRITKINYNMIYNSQFGVTNVYGVDLGHLNSPYSMVFDSNGMLYIADSGNHRIFKGHPEMAAVDSPLRQCEVLYSGPNTDKLKLYYNYVPYQGVIAYQGSNTMNYTLRALTDLRAIITTCGTGGRNTETEDNLNGCAVRLPFPAIDGNTLEWTFNGSDISYSGITDNVGILSAAPFAWGGSMSSYGGTTNNGNQGDPLLSNKLVLVQQASSSGYPVRGINTIQKQVANLTNNGGYDSLGISAGIVNSTDHLTAGYFLAVASGGSATLPLIQGELVLIVVTYRVNGTKAVIYGQTSTAVAVDLYRLPQRPVIKY